MSLKVEDVMVENVVSVQEKATVKEAAELMNQHEIGCLIVVKKGKPVGIVTETDMMKKVIASISPPPLASAPCRVAASLPSHLINQ